MHDNRSNLNINAKAPFNFYSFLKIPLYATTDQIDSFISNKSDYLLGLHNNPKLSAMFLTILVTLKDETKRKHYDLLLKSGNHPHIFLPESDLLSDEELKNCETYLEWWRQECNNKKELGTLARQLLLPQQKRQHTAGSFNFYTALGLKQDANFDDIHKSLRDLLRKYHPDKNTQQPAVEKLMGWKFNIVNKIKDFFNNPETFNLYNFLLNCEKLTPLKKSLEELNTEQDFKFFEDRLNEFEKKSKTMFTEIFQQLHRQIFQQANFSASAQTTGSSTPASSSSANKFSPVNQLIEALYRKHVNCSLLNRPHDLETTEILKKFVDLAGSTPKEGYSPGEPNILNYLINHAKTNDFIIFCFKSLKTIFEYQNKSAFFLELLNSRFNNEGKLPLHYVIAAKKLVSTLLDCGASITARKENFSPGITIRTPSPLIRGIQIGNAEIVKIMLDKSPEALNSRGDNNATPLYEAVNQSSIQVNIIQILLEKEKNLREKTINLSTTSGETPLHLAVLKGNVAVVKMLLSAGANITLKNGSQYTSLDIAKLQNNKELIDLLETELMRIRAESGRKNYSNISSTSTKSSSVKKAPLDEDLDKLSEAIAQQQDSVIEPIINKFIEMIENGNIKKFTSGKNLFTYIIEYFLYYSSHSYQAILPRLYSCALTRLSLAIEQKHATKITSIAQHCVQMFETKLFNDSTLTENPLSHIMIYFQKEPLKLQQILEELHSHLKTEKEKKSFSEKLSVDGKRPPIYLAIEMNNKEILTQFLKWGAPLNTSIDINIDQKRNKPNFTARYTPLEYAIRINNKELLEPMLLEYQKIVKTIKPRDKKRQYKRTLLQVAIATDADIAIVQMLIPNTTSQEINNPDTFGFSALHLAVKKMRLDVIKLLVTAQADVHQQRGSFPKRKNKVDEFGEKITPLSMAYLLRDRATVTASQERYNEIITYLELNQAVKTNSISSTAAVTHPASQVNLRPVPLLIDLSRDSGSETTHYHTTSTFRSDASSTIKQETTGHKRKRQPTQQNNAASSEATNTINESSNTNNRQSTIPGAPSSKKMAQPLITVGVFSVPGSSQAQTASSANTNDEKSSPAFLGFGLMPDKDS